MKLNAQDRGWAADQVRRLVRANIEAQNAGDMAPYEAAYGEIIAALYDRPVRSVPALVACSVLIASGAAFALAAEAETSPLQALETIESILLGPWVDGV